MRTIIRNFLIGISIIIVLCSLWGYRALYTSSVQEDTFFTVASGSSVKAVAQSLAQANLIPNAFFFEVAARFTGYGMKIRAGEYLLTAGSSPIAILEHFVHGSMNMVSVTIPEGLPWWEVARRFEKAELVRFNDFRDAVYDTAFLQQQGLPYTSAEGFLYPETYRFVKPMQLTRATANNIVSTMITTFREQTKGIFPSSMSEKERYNILILASIVEKEAQQKEERARIAGVYLNRINIKMILQADPTIIYGLGQNFEGRLRKKHLLDATNPYNTYKIAGLTPTPICSPSKDVIMAVLNPEKHQYLYFVATKKEGRHFFSKTLEEHNRAVQKYQLGKEVTPYSM